MKYILLFLLVISMGNCAIGPVHGALYTDNKFAGEFNPNNDVKVEKTAEGCIHNSIFTLFTWGNAGSGYIAAKNGIERIATIDHSTMNVIFGLVYRNYCTIVSGEAKK
ncbi:MAG: TRL-like family protein [Leptospiraceae bacterium]|nr:TRL-like family protein [Leptospiraceae bacterium]